MLSEGLVLPLNGLCIVLSYNPRQGLRVGAIDAECDDGLGVDQRDLQAQIRLGYALVGQDHVQVKIENQLRSTRT